LVWRYCSQCGVKQCKSSLTTAFDCIVEFVLAVSRYCSLDRLGYFKLLTVMNEFTLCLMIQNQ
jgi:hypothetical protein